MQLRATLLNREWWFYKLQQWLRIRLQLNGIFKILKYQLTCGFGCLQKILSQGCILINIEEYALHKGWLWDNLFWSPSIQTSLHYLKPIDSRFSLPHEYERHKEPREWQYYNSLHGLKRIYSEEVESTTESLIFEWPSSCINSSHDCGW